ncbi:MAG: substrate-binding domain-containing protein [Dysgonamonadaceae bacterium]|jgi:phosphate transport system substrate-binding protein|nr:substrate-binding domain-containing protein [Dysgonamonadaceae bacterium]
MKQINLIWLVSLLLFFSCINEKINADDEQNTIEGITPDNYPRVDGSTSTEPLNTLIACKLLGWNYEWQKSVFGNGIWRLVPRAESIPENFFTERVKSTQTHNAILNLIDNRTDIIISARKMSENEKDYAQSTGVSLIETPVALDALVFLLNRQNTVNSLTVRQIQDIYLGYTTHWDEVGGTNEEIKPFIRNANSGSQEMMKEIVMNNTGMPDWTVGYTDDEIIPVMAAVYMELAMYQNGICFTPHYYKEYIIRDAVGAEFVKSIAIDGIYPDAYSIKNKTYPFVANVYVSIRSDLDHNTMAYKLYEWLQTQAGKDVISESGYIPVETTVLLN